MELRQLRYFVAVARELSFTKAAGKLRVAQPALSRQIRLLEEEIGVRLLERNRRATYLTEPGRVFLAEACSLLEQGDRAIQLARKARTIEVPELNIGYVWGLFHAIVPSAVSRFRQLLPEVPVNLFDWTATGQADGISEGKIDAGFIGLEADAGIPGFARRLVGECEFIAALPEKHPAARRKHVALDSLAREPFLMISSRTYPGAWELIMRACEQAGFRPGVRQNVERGYSIVGLVASTGAIALLPESLRSLPHPGVVFRRLAVPLRANLYLAWRPTVRHPARDTFLTLFPERPVSWAAV